MIKQLNENPNYFKELEQHNKKTQVKAKEEHFHNQKPNDKNP